MKQLTSEEKMWLRALLTLFEEGCLQTASTEPLTARALEISQSVREKLVPLNTVGDFNGYCCAD